MALGDVAIGRRDGEAVQCRGHRNRTVPLREPVEPAGQPLRIDIHPAPAARCGPTHHRLTIAGRITRMTSLPSLPHTVLDRLVPIYGAARDPAGAAPMRAYMRDQFPFLGIPTTGRRLLSRQVLAGLPRPGEDDLRAVALACWDLPEREY